MLRRAYFGLIAVVVGIAVLVGCGARPQSGLARGEDLFKTCAPCHGADGRGSLALRAPAIAGLPDWYLSAQLTKFKTNVRGAHPDDEEGHRMRPMARTLHRPGDVEAASAYVASLPPVTAAPLLDGDRGAGKTQYGMICIACHGPDGRGNKALNSPPLVGQADWYLLGQLKKFKTGMRGAHKDDVTGSQMRAMVSTLADTTAMRNVVAYIATLPR